MLDEKKKSLEPGQLAQAKHLRWIPSSQRLKDSVFWETFYQVRTYSGFVETESEFLLQRQYSSTDPVTSSKSTSKP